MKTIIKRFIPYGGLCLLVLAACANPALPSGEEAFFATTEEMAAYLAGKPANTAAAPYRVVLSGVDLSAPGALDEVFAAFNGRFVDLDASRCTGGEIPARSGNFPSGGAELLTGIILPESAEKIGRNAFLGFPALKTVMVSGRVTEIGSFAFAAAPLLEEITLPAALATLGEGVFENCPRLAICRVRGTPPALTGSVFASSLFTGSPLAVVLVPTMQAYWQYAGHVSWRAYKDRLRLAEPDPSYHPYELYFDSGSRRTNRDDPLKLPTRSTASGVRVVLAPVLWGFTPGAEFTWTVHTATVDERGHAAAGSAVSAGTPGPQEYFTFQTSAPGKYLVTCTAREAGNTADASVVVDVVAEAAPPRPRVEARRIADYCWEFVPASGNFVGVYPGMDISGENGHDEAWVADQNTRKLRFQEYDRSNEGQFWDGWSLNLLSYFIFSWDHSIMRSEAGGEIGLSGNNFGSFTEPGIVSVMQDTNGNGLPDDTWYELKGSEYGNLGSHPRYAFTLYRPWRKVSGNIGEYVWRDNRGQTGTKVDTYPWFVEGEAVTFTGSIIPPSPAATGYTDTPTYLFSIADAVQADGTPVTLTHIDFVRTHGALLFGNGPGGDTSSEFRHPYDAAMPPDRYFYGEAEEGGQYSYLFRNRSGYNIDIRLFNIGEAAPFEIFTLNAGMTVQRSYNAAILAIDFAGSNASLSTSGNTAEFVDTGGSF